MNTINIVKNTIIENSLIKKGEKVLCALSGGSDSVAMTAILAHLSLEMDFKIYVAHINHNIREEAFEDALFVKEFSNALGIECFIKSADVLGYAKQKGISMELAGREIRYDFFNECLKKYNIDKIATAHNKNDSVESILLHLIRGCGIDGLSGIPVMRDNNIIRPVINLSKEEIVKYCNDNNLKFVEDKTNFETDYTRNKIRHKIIPEIEGEINKNFINTLINNSKLYKETAEFIESYSKKIYNDSKDNKGLIVDKISNEEDIILKTIIQLFYLEQKNKKEKLPLVYIDKIIELIRKNKTSKTLNITGGDSVRIEYNRLFFEKTKACFDDFLYEIEIGKKLYIKEAEMEILVDYEKEIEKNTNDKIYFYIDDVDGIYVRNKRAGDSFMPYKMNGTKKISDLFCDMKIKSSKRSKIPILFKNDKVVWVCGIRADKRFTEGKILLSCKIFGRSSN